MKSDILAILILGMAQTVAVGAIFVCAWLWAKRQGQKALVALNAELLALVEAKPCQSAAVLLAAGKVIGSEAARSMKASLMADQAHIQRALNIEGENAITEVVSQQQPLMGGMLAGMGRNKRKSLLGNPLIQGLVSHYLSGQRNGESTGSRLSGSGQKKDLSL
jgi:hypothetical protein